MSTVKSKKLQVGTDASASNNFTIYQPATPDGTLRIGVGNADSPTEVGRFTSAGYKPATAPTFRVYMSAAQSISHATSTKAQFNTIVWDTTSDFDTTNYRFQPSVAGYYLINAMGHLLGLNDGKANYISFAKNGSGDSTGGVFRTGSFGNTGPAATTIMYLNGTTDYVECYFYHEHGSAINLANNSNLTIFMGALLQQA